MSDAVSTPAATPTGRDPIEAPPMKVALNSNTLDLEALKDGKDPFAQAPIDPRQLETYRKFGVADDVIKQVAARQPVTAEEYRLAQHKSASLKSDPAWTRRYLEGGVEERRTMMTLSIILGSKIKEE